MVTNRRLWLCALAFLVSQFSFPLAWTQQEEIPVRGRLIMIGGGLGISNKPVFKNLIEAAGGVEKARMVVLPAASLSLDSAYRFRRELMEFGVREDQVEILNVLHSNAASASHDPSHVEKIDRATAVYMTGGDQVRLVQALTTKDGNDTPLLSAMRRLFRRGGLIAGTSAGASAQSVKMLAASGLPSELVDEGLDALDFGLTTDPLARGLLATKGLGFLEHGIIDQHFLQYRGRLARLSRVTLESKLPFGIGIDKNSAIRVDPDGRITVISGTAIVVSPAHATSTDGPLGFSLNNMSVAMLSSGDIFNTTQLSFTLDPSKSPIAEHDLTYNGSFLITDIGAGPAIAAALIGGLAENKQAVQEGVVHQYHGDTSHGYRYRLGKKSTTRAYHANTLDGSLYSLLDVELDIAPIANGLHPSSTQVPNDMENLDPSTRSAITAIAFRGILTTNTRLEFRPDEPISRRDFAMACVRSVHLPAASGDHQTISDLGTIDTLELLQAIEAGFLSIDSQNRLHPDAPITASDVVSGLKRLARICVSQPSKAFLQAMEQLAETNQPTVPRSRVAWILANLLFPQW